MAPSIGLTGLDDDEIDPCNIPDDTPAEIRQMVERAARECGVGPAFTSDIDALSEMYQFERAEHMKQLVRARELSSFLEKCGLMSDYAFPPGFVDATVDEISKARDALAALVRERMKQVTHE